ncbi:MAG: prepilin-type N-terminal cleavage/methylation domain-containing protein [Kiritimatiellae bacterium]|jgi:prepilin-type N-terminal cleavage/methylation domain-containing protein|nr:prepilin-type N-terminal cleavage/methylation domain-containing protein [Kiritimatiellia bacterium]
MKRHTVNNRSLSGGGFTLVEMLVVIAIIVLLLTLLPPALKQARSAAQKRVCASNIRSITQSLLVYVNDHGGEFPHYQWRAESYPTSFQWGLKQPQWEAGLPKFYPDYIPDRDTFFCPADIAGSYMSRSKRSFFTFPGRPSGLNEVNISYVYFFGRRNAIPSNSTDTRNRRGGFQYVYQNVHPAQTTMIADTMRLRGAGDSRYYDEIHNIDYWNHYGENLRNSGGHLGYGDGHVRWWSGADHFPVEWPRWARRMNGARDHVFVGESPYVPED